MLNNNVKNKILNINKLLILKIKYNHIFQNIQNVRLLGFCSSTTFEYIKLSKYRNLAYLFQHQTTVLNRNLCVCVVCV